MKLQQNFFQSLLSRYQIGLETSTKRSDFIFDCVHSLYDKSPEIYFKLCGSYIDSPDWRKTKKAKINLINKKDNSYFQYGVTIMVNLKEIKQDQQRMTKYEPFIDKYNCAGINYPSEKDDWKKFKKNNLTIALNVLYGKKEESCSSVKTSIKQ